GGNGRATGGCKELSCECEPRDGNCRTIAHYGPPLERATEDRLKSIRRISSKDTRSAKATISSLTPRNSRPLRSRASAQSTSISHLGSHPQGGHGSDRRSCS